ncbi:hypothetical protein QE152_g29900 [Popillia japonica]|uniref:Uncharacterized protein n=1 Tax=Popillia japonica TaxID=7064 RepID=A0AAW1JGC6_POPJA
MCWRVCRVEKISLLNISRWTSKRNLMTGLIRECNKESEVALDGSEWRPYYRTQRASFVALEKEKKKPATEEGTSGGTGLSGDPTIAPRGPAL